MKDLKTGWLSPIGDLFECDTYTHCRTAREIVYKFGYAWGEYKSADNCLMAKGWAYIGISEFDYEWRIGWGKFLTEYQKNFLKSYFEDTQRPVNIIAKARWESEQ